MEGIRTQPWPIGHVAWLFAELPEFEARAARFLAEGRRRNERVIFIADDPGVRRWPTDLRERGELVLESTHEAYASLRKGSLDDQKLLFEQFLQDARWAGFAGIRVVADNTVVALEDLDRWKIWETIADNFIRSNHVTGLCAFDRSRLNDTAMRELASLHSKTIRKAGARFLF